MISTSNRFSIRVALPAVGVPAWVNELAINSGWQYVAGGAAAGSAYWPAAPQALSDWQRGARIVDVRMDPSPQAPTFAGIEDVIQPWCGAAMNFDRKELYLPANGGGGSYTGNEVYGLQLGLDVPAWKLFSESTPVAMMELDDTSHAYAWDGTDIPCTHRDGPSGGLGDGRPRAFHSCGNIQYANGRVWSVMQSAVTPNLNAQGLFSWDREWVATQPDERAAYVQGDILPWRWHGTAGLEGSGPSYAFACSAYDPVAQRIWAYADRMAWAIDAVTGGLAVPDFSHGIPLRNGQTRGGWAVYVPGSPRRILVGLCRRSGQEILVHDLEHETFSLMAATPAMQWDPDSYWVNWESPGVENGGLNQTPGSIYIPDDNPFLENEFAYGMGAAYSEGNVYVGVVPARLGGTLGGQVRVIDVDAVLSGRDSVTELVNTGVRPIPLEGGPSFLSRVQWGNWQRFNIAELGTAKVLIHAADAHGPAQVWRIA